MDDSDDNRPSIFVAGNTNNACLVCLRERGYTLIYENGEDGGMPIWCAENDQVRLGATNPEELLGLAIVWEQFGTGFNVRSPDVKSEVIDASYGDCSD